MDNKARLFNQVSDFVFLKYIFNLFKLQKLFSMVSSKTGRTTDSFKKVQTVI